MTFDFNKEDCKSQISSKRFGICDDQSGDPAYVDATDEDKWVCLCFNPDELRCTFTAIDNCIEILRPNGEMEQRCDGALEYSTHILFIELKSVRTSGWISGGIAQLKTTVLKFFEDKPLKQYGQKRAILANNKRPFFHYGQQERMESFRTETGVRLIIDNEIVIR